MQLLRSITIDSVPSVLELVRFGLVTFLQSVRDLLLIYPINVTIFCILIFAIVYKVVSRFKGRQNFNAIYEPLKHQDNSLEEVKLLKKQIRQIQAELIDMIKKGKQQSQNQRNLNQQPQTESLMMQQEQIETQIANFLKEESQRSQIIELVEEQLQKTVKQAYEQIIKLNTS